jgi:hypothetical protein
MANCGERSRHDLARVSYGQQIINALSGILEQWGTSQLIIC